MTPADYGQAARAGFQDSYQNILMGMQAGRDQREQELDYRRQQFLERKWEMEQKLIEQERQLTEQRLEILKIRAQREEKMEDEIVKIVEENKALENEIARLKEDPRRTGQINISEAMPSPSEVGQEANKESPKNNDSKTPDEPDKENQLKIPDHLKEYEEEIKRDIAECRKILNRLWLKGDTELLKMNDYDMSDVSWAPPAVRPEIFIFIDSYIENYKNSLLQFGK